MAVMASSRLVRPQILTRTADVIGAAPLFDDPAADALHSVIVLTNDAEGEPPALGLEKAAENPADHRDNDGGAKGVAKPVDMKAGNESRDADQENGVHDENADAHGEQDERQA